MNVQHQLRTKLKRTAKATGLLGLFALSLSSLSGCESTTSADTQKTADKAPITSAKAPTQDDGVFTNPLFPNGADPWLEYWDGNYYLTTTTWTSELVMRKSPTLAGLADATPVNVWSATDPARCCNFWAFEFHRVKGPDGYRWYMMYTAGTDGTLDNQHLNVLESAGDDPMGPYEYKGALMPDVWNIDGNYLSYKDKLYVIYSQWQGDQQLNIIAEMENPWTLKKGTPHTVITRPELDWEISGRKVTEGAEILQHNGRTFMTYSASFCNTPDYKLGMLELVGDDPLDANSWKKFDQPVFERTTEVFGPGHNGFFTSPDGSEDWLVYHGNDSVEHGCSATRSLRAQKFTWHDDGTPNFAKPVTPGVEVAPPSGEYGPLVTRVQGQRYNLVNATSGLCLDIAADPQDARAVQRQCAATNGQWVIDATTDGFVRLANREDSKFLELANCSDADNAKTQSAAWRNNFCQQWKVAPSTDGNVTITNRYTEKPLAVAGCSAAQNQAVLQQGKDTACGDWQLQPVGSVAVMSQQSGKALSVAGTVKAGTNVEQQAFTHSDAQQWFFAPTDTGYVALKQDLESDYCAAVANNALVPGANVEMASCETKTAQWRIAPVAGGGVMLINRYTKQALGLSDCGLADKTNFAQQPDLGNKCQIFHLREPN
ncbi:family 43 glycosylhydrolase [Pseudoalteromonas sp. KG3]|uniref:Family 43 glycosylhydrolase n=1 Tax=Pseudoalteromonas prydzensis TaxID=182141 RepID=A0ABR9FKM4_9GAMM|nr:MULTISPECIES: family 43 glycosylhydrolase [Pseudoalteromonas]MBE0457383.1 family 43 glycosylhydrolase [Pseudoalteromonas prydzensis]WKD25947.1 family 43 glycosylhydrolase [Pseudoalteromonas sp. KG3]